jgi:hypothetical protein
MPSGRKIVGAPLGRGVLPLPELHRIIFSEADLDRLILEIPFVAGAGGRQAVFNEDNAVRESVRYCRDMLGIGGL